MHREKHFYFKMLITFEPNVAQRSVASQNDHKSKACLPEASNTAFTMYRRLKRRLRRLYEAPFLAPFFWRLNSPSDEGNQGNLVGHLTRVMRATRELGCNRVEQGAMKCDRVLWECHRVLWECHRV